VNTRWREEKTNKKRRKRRKKRKEEYGGKMGKSARYGLSL
jgi:hypothetical protein